MKALVVYESMFGNTRHIADAIADGLGDRRDVPVVSVREVTAALMADAEIVVVGAPTHMHGLSRPSSRAATREQAAKAGSGLSFEPGADGIGLREWLATLGPISAKVTAFDTRLHGPGIVTGRASRRIARMMRRRGARLVVAPQSFFVDRQNRLVLDEIDRARRWGMQIAGRVRRTAPPTMAGSKMG